MPTRRGTDTRRLDGAPVTVRLDIELRGRIDDASAAAGLSAASWLRAIADLAAPGIGGAVRPTPRRRPLPSPPPEWLRDVDRLREVVAELGGNLTRIAAAARADGFAAAHAEIEAIRGDVKRAGRDLVALMERRRTDEGADDGDDT